MDEEDRDNDSIVYSKAGTLLEKQFQLKEIKFNALNVKFNKNHIHQSWFFLLAPFIFWIN